MKAKVDPDICIGCGICADVCPAVFEMQDGLAVATAAEVPAAAQTDCRQAAEDCPVEAIAIEDSA